MSYGEGYGGGREQYGQDDNYGSNRRQQGGYDDNDDSYGRNQGGFNGRQQQGGYQQGGYQQDNYGQQQGGYANQQQGGFEEGGRRPHHQQGAENYGSGQGGTFNQSNIRSAHSLTCHQAGIAAREITETPLVPATDQVAHTEVLATIFQVRCTTLKPIPATLATKACSRTLFRLCKADKAVIIKLMRTKP